MFEAWSVFLSQKQAAKKKVVFKRAEKYAKEYQAKERNEIRLNRIAKKSGNFYVPAEPRLAFVLRIRGYVVFIISHSVTGHAQVLALFSIYRSLPFILQTPPSPMNSSTLMVV